MLRMQRLLYPGAMIHIMDRGIDGKDIFHKGHDKIEFLNRFSKHRSETGFLCYAWCLMDNNYHFLLRTNEIPAGKLMRPLNGGFARWYNKKYNRQG
jgi:putative transposase